MKAMTLTAYGENAEFKEAEVPQPGATPGHVVVQVAATSVNTVDTMIRQLGQENLPLSPDLPAVLGMDFAGTVVSVGADVTGFAVGDDVYGCAGGLSDLQGALAEYMLADADLIAHKPKSLSMREAAALPLVGITAYEGLKRANIQAGQTVLVHGGTGGVGHVAVQLAKHFGADVYATVSSDEQVAIVEGYGATAINRKIYSVADYIAKHTNGAGFDIVYDSVGGENMLNSFEAAALNGQIATTVSMLELDMAQAHFKGLSIHVVFMLIPMLHDHGRKEHGAILASMGKIVDTGDLRPLLDNKRYRLHEVADAYDRLSGKKAIGKVVIDVQ